MTHQPRKRFGQNFLHDKNIIDRIVRAIKPQMDDNIVEIGPGLGALTDHVLPYVHKLHAVEIDKDLAQRWREQQNPKLNLIEQDALEFDFRTLGKPLRVFGNLPYNISTPLLFHLMVHIETIQDMTFMLQYEVVERLAAAPGNKHYGRLSVMCQYYCSIEHLFNVPPTAFRPPPKVNSAIVRLTPHPKILHPATDVERLSTIVRLAFGQRRKMLRKSLHDVVDTTKLEAAGIDPTRRPEELSVTEFVQIANLFNSQTE